MLDLVTRQFFTSRDVVFMESEFPFSKNEGNKSYDVQDSMEQGTLQFTPLHTQLAGDMNLHGRRVI